MANDRQITGNIGVYHVARELSRLGWNVMLTVRNARGADLYAVSQCETIVHPIQIKAHSAEPNDTQLGLNPEALVTPWWVFVIRALSEDPICYIVSLEDIRSRMTRDPGTRSGKPESDRAYWFDRRYYKSGSDRELVDAREGWACLGNPKTLLPVYGAEQDSNPFCTSPSEQGAAAPLVFLNDDEGFITWREAHTDGVVLNMPNPAVSNKRSFQLRHAKLHSAACPFIRGDRNGERRWTSNGYFKVCADASADIEQWLASNVDSPGDWRAPRCQSCGGDWR